MWSTQMSYKIAIRGFVFDPRDQKMSYFVYGESWWSLQFGDNVQDEILSI